MNDYKSVSKESKKSKEANDCSVIAITIATGEKYKKVHGMLKALGRKDRSSTLLEHSFKVMKELADVETVQPKSKTLISLEKDFPTGTYIGYTRNHMFCLKEGLIEDWSRGRRFHVKGLLKIINREVPEVPEVPENFIPQVYKMPRSTSMLYRLFTWLNTFAVENQRIATFDEYKTWAKEAGEKCPSCYRDYYTWKERAK